MNYRVTQRMVDKSEVTFYCSSLSELENRVDKRFSTLFITSEIANDSIIELEKFINRCTSVNVEINNSIQKCLLVTWDKLMELKNSITVNEIHFDAFNDKYAVFTMHYYDGTEWDARRKLVVKLGGKK